METILDKNASSQFRDDYQRYGIYITFRRVEADYKDGLKPVQRRILWAMYNDTKAVTHTVKSAGIVGDVMKKYHPHGDASLYNTIKPMANWFECYLPLIQPKGNWGSFFGDPAAAPRYTEAKLSQFSIDCIFDDIKKSAEAVTWSDNYDYTTKEPEFLPCKIPLLLINGSFGIGLGKRAEIPTHNTNEVIDATLTLLDNPSAEIVLAPDHCQKCEITEGNFKEISRTGFGYYKVRGVIDIEEIKGKTALVIKSCPNLVFMGGIKDKIDDLVASKKIIQIDSAHDDSDYQNLRYVIYLKPGSDPEYVKNVIYKNTELEHMERVNFEVLDGLNTMRMSYKSYLLSFIENRKITKYRLYANRLQAVDTRIHEREAYIKVLESGQVDEIIQYIRKQKDINDGNQTEYLIKKLGITDLQARYILNANLKTLSIGYLNRYKEEAAQAKAEREFIMSMVMDDRNIINEIRQELIDIKEKYGHPRNCKIIKVKGDSNEIPHGIMQIAVTEKNFIKKVPDGTPLGGFKGDSVRTLIKEDNAESILIFDNMGKVFKLPIHKIPFSDKNSNGIDIRFLIKGLNADITTIIPDRIFKMLTDKDKPSQPMSLVCLTKTGLIKRMELSEFVNIPPSGVLYTKLIDNDYVTSIKIVPDATTILIFSSNKVMSYPVANIPSLKRNARGVKTFKAATTEGMTEIRHDKTNLLVITTNGRMNKLNMNGLPNIEGHKKTTSVVKLTGGNTIQNIVAVNDEDEVHVVTMTETFIIHPADIPSGSSISIGEKIIPLKNDKIIRSYTLQ